MFVRRKKNPSGVISVQVIDKSNRNYKVLKTMGRSAIESEIQQMVKAGQRWIKSYQGVIEIDFLQEQQAFEEFTHNIESLHLEGLDLLIGKLFDDIGFNQIRDEVFRYLCIYRVCFPKSKLKTTEYLYRYHHIDWNEDKIYRYLDKLYAKQKAQVQRISYEHTLQVLDEEINIIFYDVTTLYFEIDQEDDLRKTGFSKDGKHCNPQIVLGLLVSRDGYPLAYEIYEGNKFEGNTLLPIIDKFKEKYEVDQLVIVADSGLLSKANMEELESRKYEYILGARIKNVSQELRDKILSLKLTNGQSAVIDYTQSRKIIISYSEQRAKKDNHNRERGLRRLSNQIKSGRLTKAHINNRGYNKFLTMYGTVNLAIDESKVHQDSQWDGLKGYITNTDLDKDDVIENYRHLWMIEKAFRISKTDIKIRPIYHRLPRRIEAHICISFVAYKIYKELERFLKQKQSKLSPEKAIEIAKSIYAITVKIPNTNEVIKRTLLLSEEQKMLAKLFNFKV
jgi:transposase